MKARVGLGWTSDVLVATCGFVTPSGPGAVIVVGLAPAFVLARVRGPDATDPSGAPL